MKSVWPLVLLVAAACSSTPPRLVHTAVESSVLSQEMAYAVWTPVDFAPAERLPLVVFLHGGGDSENSFDKFEVGQHLDAMLAEGRIPRAVVVVPRGELGFWENWKDGSRAYRDWVINEVMPAVRDAYHTADCPTDCHVAGVSMGGHGTMRFAFYHPDLFSSASALSAPQLDVKGIQEFTDSFWIRLFVPVKRIWGDVNNTEAVAAENVYEQWRTQTDLKGVRLLIAWAAEDREGIIFSNKKLHKTLDDRGIEHVAFEFEGDHGWRSWTPVIDRVLRFAIWGAVDAAGPSASPVARSSDGGVKQEASE